MHIKRISPDDVDKYLAHTMQYLRRELVAVALEAIEYPSLDTDDLKEITADPKTALLMAVDDKAGYVGTTTIHVWRYPVRTRGFLDDVVVDLNHRGRGIGTQLVVSAIGFAIQNGADHAELTCNSQMRPDAARLYVKLGFVKSETDVYHMELSH